MHKLLQMVNQNSMNLPKMNTTSCRGKNTPLKALKIAIRCFWPSHH